MLHTHIGVRFVYEGGGSSNTGGPFWEDKNSTLDSLREVEDILTPEVVAALPVEWMIQLKQGAEAVDVELLFSVIEQIRGHHAALADALAQLVENFEYDEVLALLPQADQNASS